MKTWLALLIFAGWFAAGCNPVRRIDMKNNSGDSAEIIWTINEDNMINNPFLLHNSKELKFKIPQGKQNTIKMSFGVGEWSPSEVEKLVKNLTSLEIISANQNIKIDSLSQLKDFLLARRKGIGGARIEIVIPQ